MAGLDPGVRERFVDYCHGRRLEIDDADGRALAKAGLMFRHDLHKDQFAYIITLEGWALSGVVDDDGKLCPCCAKRWR